MSPLSKNVVAAAWACMLASSCGPTSAPSVPQLGGPTGTITWGPVAGKDNPLPGIDQGNLYHLGTAFVVWCDAGGGGGGHSSTSSGSVACQGTLFGQDQRRVEFSCEITDGRAGRASINGVPYELADGNLFLVSTATEHCRVKQLKRDLSTLKFEREALEALGKNDAGIAEFFSAKPK